MFPPIWVKVREKSHLHDFNQVWFGFFLEKEVEGIKWKSERGEGRDIPLKGFRLVPKKIRDKALKFDIRQFNHKGS